MIDLMVMVNLNGLMDQRIKVKNYFNKFMVLQEIGKMTEEMEKVKTQISTES